MHSRTVFVDFSKKAGKLKPLFSSSAIPVSDSPFYYDLTEHFSALGVDTVRLSPSETLSIGISDIFPDFSLDPRFEASYNFTHLDAAATMIKGQGMDVFLTLGEKPDRTRTSLRNLAPRDMEKWADICIGIVRHLNEGFANGFKYGVKQVEIWQEADSLDSFRSSPEEYYELYSLVSRRLKDRFPRLRIGGYSARGFYSLNHVDGSPDEKRSIDFLEGFLLHIAGRKAPLDFFSWKCFVSSAEELALHSNYADSYLVNAGFKKAKSIVSDFNLRKGTADFIFDKSYPAFLAASLISAEKSQLDMLYYSDLSPTSALNALYSYDDRLKLRKYAAYGVAEAFGELVSIGTAVDSGEDYRRELYTLAAGGKDRGALLIVTGEYKGQLIVEVKNSPFPRCSVKGMAGGGERGAGVTSAASGVSLASGRLTLKVGHHQVYLISFE